MEVLDNLKKLGKRLGLMESEAHESYAPRRSTFNTKAETARIAEKSVNHWLRQEFSRHPFIRYLSVEFEDNNQINLQIISKYYMQILVEAELADAWHDHKTSTLQLRWKTVRLLKMPLLPDFISEKITYYLLNIIGFLLNPMEIKPGMELRLDGSSLRLDFASYWPQCRRKEIFSLFHDQTGAIRASEFFVVAAETDKGFITLHLYPLSDTMQASVREDYGKRESQRYKLAITRLQWVDALFLSGIALGVSAIVIILRQNMNIGAITFSFSWYFMLSLAIVFVSLMMLNVPRWLYQFFTGKTVNMLQSASENITYRLERYKRDIVLEMREVIKHYGTLSLAQDSAGRQDMDRLLLKAGRQRFLAWRMERTMESLNRWRKVKYGLAYAVTIISEFVSYKWL